MLYLVLVNHLQKTKKENYLSQHIYQNELDKACFQDDITYGYYKEWTKRTVSDQILRDKAFDITVNPKYDGYQHTLVSMINKFFDKISSGSTIKNKNMSEQRPLDLARIVKVSDCMRQWRIKPTNDTIRMTQTSH